MIASDDAALARIFIYDNPEYKRHPNYTKTDQLPKIVSEVIMLPGSGCVRTSFGRVGTVGMERGYSWYFVPFKAVCVHTEFPGNRATDPNIN